MPVEFAAHVYDTLHEAGASLGLVDAGYCTIDALRIEAGRRAWSAELGPDETPIEAGLMPRAVKIDEGAFIGRDALLAKRASGVRKRLAILVLDDPQAWPWGGEGYCATGSRSARSRPPVGVLRSAGPS